MAGASLSPFSRSPESRSEMPLQGWLIPSWIASLLFHGMLAASLLVLAQLPSCRHDISGDGGDSFRKVGIRVLPAAPAEHDSKQPSPQTSQTEPVSENSSNSNAASVETPALSPEPPIALNLPKMPESPAIIGAGQLPTLSSMNMESLIQPTNPGGSKSPGGAPVSGGTSFLGIDDVGKRFVYVIDRSFSMANDHALQAAKMELLASLERLDETQQFQVIFYNNDVVVLDTRGGRFDVFWGTDAQRLKVAEQIRGITPAAGTRHLPALVKALTFKPDVIFLLTDGASESALDSRDLEQIQRLNRYGAHIHCIEFGRGRESALGEAGNFLKVLARQNDGKYVYRNLQAGI